MFDDHPNDPTYLGLRRSEAEDLIARNPRVRGIRIFDLDEFTGQDVLVTADYRTDRINLVITEGLVTEATWG